MRLDGELEVLQVGAVVEELVLDAVAGPRLYVALVRVRVEEETLKHCNIAISGFLCLLG